MKRLIVSCFVVGVAFNANAQNYWKKNAGKTAKIIFTSASANEKMIDKGTVKFEKMVQPKETDACIFVDPDFKYQKLIGIGGAITDAAAETLYKLPKNKQKEIIDAYYGKNGLGYTVVRTN
ncbi:MAG: glycosyl hydrolase, partial [Chryseobacterium taeanense]